MATGHTMNQEVLFYILLALVVGFVHGRGLLRPDAYQNRGEARLSRVARQHFQGPDYFLMNHITLPLGDGTTQIDHILVSRFGVFVIETKHYKGWIFANSNHARWTQVLFNWKFRFQNPIVQNLRHVRAVQQQLDFLSPGVVKSIVVFTGDAQFRTPVPTGVFSLSAFVDHIRAQRVEIMSANRMQFCVGRLETARLAISEETDVQHVQNLERWHGRTS